MRSLVLILSTIAFLAGCAHHRDAPELQFSIEDGAIRNDFLRDGPIAAHIVLKSSVAPRLIVAFPAGNSGVGVWFSETEEPARWDAPRKLETATMGADGGGLRRGVKFETTISSPRLEVTKAILSNIRVLRDYGYTGKTPEIVDAPHKVEKSAIVFERRRIDGAEGYYLSIDALNGRVEGSAGAPALVSDDASPLELRIVALTGEEPLTGIPQGALLSETAGSDAQQRNVLTFLAYEEKLLAGSWQYNTYFGRDTLMSVALLGDALRPAAIEAGLSSVLDRLSEGGEVAHEEDIGEYALLRRRRDGEPASDDPILDYKMIDDDFMLAPVLAAYVLDTAQGRSRAAAFLERRSPSGVLYSDLVALNLGHVIGAARAYGADPRWSNLIRLKSDDPPVGEWRDSNNGLGGGVFPYDVNAALVPAALIATSRLAGSGLLGESAAHAALAEESRRLSAIWARSAPSHFRVIVDAKTAARQVAKAAARDGLDPERPGARIEGPIEFPALALDRSGAPIKVMHSDVGFAMLFGEPAESDLMAAAELVQRPFPAGLVTPAGMVVANAALAPDDVAAKFGSDRYHGAVIWSWQQALMIAGLKRQLARADIGAAVRAKLSQSLAILQTLAAAGGDHRSAELWTWSVEDHVIERAPFGESASDETESNAAQLWSAAHLAAPARPTE